MPINKIKAGSIDTGSITSAKIAADAVTSAKIANDTIANADISSSAAIAYSKLNLATSIANADISSSAAIAYSKLNLGTSITSSDLASTVITGATAEATVAGGDQILIYDDSASALRKMTRTNFVSGVSGVNTPAFLARANSQSIADNVDTKIQFSVEDFDTASAYDNTTNYRFTVPSGQAGKYHFLFEVFIAGASPGSLYDFYINFKINGTQELQRGWNMNSAYPYQATVCGSHIKQMAVGDYAEVFVRCDTNAPGSNWNTGAAAGGHTMFMGYKLIE
jgi:hypothetical protein